VRKKNCGPWLTASGAAPERLRTHRQPFPIALPQWSVQHYWGSQWACFFFCVCLFTPQQSRSTGLWGQDIDLFFVMFSKFRCWRRQKKHAPRFWNREFNQFINSLIYSGSFWELVFFSASQASGPGLMIPPLLPPRLLLSHLALHCLHRLLLLFRLKVFPIGNSLWGWWRRGHIDLPQDDILLHPSTFFLSTLPATHRRNTQYKTGYACKSSENKRHRAHRVYASFPGSHKKYSVRDRICFAGLQKARDAERSAHTILPAQPRFQSFLAHHLEAKLNLNSKIAVGQKRLFVVLWNPYFCFCWCLRPIKSRKRDFRRKNHEWFSKSLWQIRSVAIRNRKLNLCQMLSGQN